MREDELTALFDEYADVVYRLAYAYLRSAHDAEDAVQAVFLKLIEGRARPLPGKERPLLTQLTVNYCRDELRAARRRSVPLDEAIPFEQPGDRALFEAVLALPPKYRAVVHLHYYDGYSFPEIAAFLHLTPSAVSMRLHRARKILKKQLGRDC